MFKRFSRFPFQECNWRKYLQYHKVADFFLLAELVDWLLITIKSWFWDDPIEVWQSVQDFLATEQSKEYNSDDSHILEECLAASEPVAFKEDVLQLAKTSSHNPTAIMVLLALAKKRKINPLTRFKIFTLLSCELNEDVRSEMIELLIWSS